MLLVDGKIACVIDSSLGAPIKEHWYISYCKHDKPPVAICYSVGKDNWHFITNTLVEAKRKLVEIYCAYNEIYNEI
jgi:hypothetical protein